METKEIFKIAIKSNIHAIVNNHSNFNLFAVEFLNSGKPTTLEMVNNLFTLAYINQYPNHFNPKKIVLNSLPNY